MHTSDHDSLPRDPTHPAWVTEELIRTTLKVWQPFYKTPLTRDDAITIILSAGRLFGVLSRKAA
jgi:hypothetical protein